MSLFRKLSIASLILTVAGHYVGWGGEGGTAETAAEIALLVKTFGGGGVSPSDSVARTAADQPSRGGPAGSAEKPDDPTAVLLTLLK